MRLRLLLYSANSGLHIPMKNETVVSDSIETAVYGALLGWLFSYIEGFSSERTLWGILFGASISAVGRVLIHMIGRSFKK